MIYTDRSRYVAGLDHCMMRRWHEYHSFPDPSSGVGGFRPKAQDIFLSTGSALHKGLEHLLLAVIKDGAAPERDAARGFIAAVLASYREGALATGISGALPEGYADQARHVIEEQACLVEGLFWCFYRGLLPWLLENFEILAVEQEETYVAGCDCGLGSGVGEPSDHKRVCSGVAIMSRPDFVGIAKADQSLVLFDFKSTGYTLDAREHEHLLQVIFGSLGVERRYSRPCLSHYFIGLHKGKREADRGSDVKRQRSPLCYGYLRPSAGMLDPGDWKSSYEWEENGKTRRVTKDYLRTPVWEAHFSEKESGPLAEISNVEHLVFSQGLEFAQGQCSYLGPSQRPEHLVKRVLAQVVAHEQEWADRARLIREGAPLDAVVPASWDCYPYGRPCAYMEICFESPGFEAPLESAPERWERRVPHHEPELRLLGERACNSMPSALDSPASTEELGG